LTEKTLLLDMGHRSVMAARY